MSHKPLSMKTLTRLSQKPMVNSEKSIKTSTMDARHAAEQARRSTIQRTSAAREADDKRKP